GRHRGTLGKTRSRSVGGGVDSCRTPASCGVQHQGKASSEIHFRNGGLTKQIAWLSGFRAGWACAYEGTQRNSSGAACPPRRRRGESSAHPSKQPLQPEEVLLRRLPSPDIVLRQLREPQSGGPSHSPELRK